MSSLAAARADNFYNPPSWDPSKGSRDRFQNSRGANQFQQRGLVRFEMPFNFVCDGAKRGVAEHNVGAGTRFNAKKVAAGQYFSTKLWEFHTFCHQCGNGIAIKTDPKNRAYEVLRGGRVRIEAYTAEAAGVRDVLSEEVLAKRERDKIFDLERDTEQKTANERMTQNLKNLIRHKKRAENDYDLVRIARKRFDRRKEALSAPKSDFFGGIRLPLSKSDVFAAKVNKLRSEGRLQRSKMALLRQKARGEVRDEPLFDTAASKARMRAKKIVMARGIRLN